MNKDFILKTKQNNEIELSVFGIDKNKINLVIIVHGFKGFKDWGFFPFTGSFFADLGFNSVTFNFSHNGVDIGSKDFNNLEKFARNSCSLEVNELNEIIDACAYGEIEGIKPENIYLIGHSRGGGISLLCGKNKYVKKIACWASVVTFDRYSARQKNEWKSKGVFEVLNTRTNQLMKMNYSFLEDIEQNKSEFLNIEKAVSELHKPLLLAHGSEDLAVRVSESERLYELSDKSMTEILIINNTGHTFDIQHPFTHVSEKFQYLLNKTLNFFNQSNN